MKNKITSIILILLVFSLPLTILLTTFEVVAFDLDYYIDKYQEYNIMSVTKISKEDLGSITDKLLKYLKYQEDDIVIHKNVGGNIEQIFGEKEILHLEDVKVLFLKGFLIRNISFIITMLSILLLIILDKRKLYKAFIISVLTPIFIMIILFILMSTDFNKYFTYFHLILFDNDLWLLNPNTDILIQMYPLDFFTSIAYKIVSYFIIEMILLFTAGTLLLKFDNKLHKSI